MVKIAAIVVGGRKNRATRASIFIALASSVATSVRIIELRANVLDSSASSLDCAAKSIER
jgi:hypothetical protein